MREIQMHPAKKRKPHDIVRRLQFFANGAELLACVGPERFTYDGREGYTERFHLYEFASNSTCELHGGSWFVRSPSRGGPTADPSFTPNREWFAFEPHPEDEDDPAEGSVYLVDAVDSEEESGIWAHLPSPPYGIGGMAFTPDGSALLAVRNIYEGVSGQGGHWAPDVVRLTLATCKNPIGFEEKTNPLTHRTYRTPVYDIRWEPVMPLPHDKIRTIGLSADGKLLAVAGVHAVVHVVDLTRKAVVASLPWEGRFRRDGKPVRVSFDPASQWVVMLVNGRLFARPLGEGKAWQTKSTLGYVHDFAYHPTGRVLCAVFRDGEARYLDPLTGKVRQAFKWSKKPSPLYSVAFAPDGLTCAAGGENGKVILWDMDV